MTELLGNLLTLVRADAENDKFIFSVVRVKTIENFSFFFGRHSLGSKG